MPKVFHVVVTDANGKTRVKRATIGGENDAFTAEDLSKHYQDLNVFPGAKKIEIHETQETLPATISKLFKFIPKPGPVTPAAEIVPAPATPPPPPAEREKTSIGDSVGSTDRSTQPAKPKNNK